MLLLLPLVPNCRAAPPVPKPALPEGLPPIMKDLRIAGRNLKRAIILEDRSRFGPLGDTLLAAARRLDPLESPPGFAERARTLIDRSETLAAALPDADTGRIEALFGEMVDGCISCHRTYRPQEGN